MGLKSSRLKTLEWNSTVNFKINVLLVFCSQVKLPWNLDAIKLYFRKLLSWKHWSIECFCNLTALLLLREQYVGMQLCALKVNLMSPDYVLPLLQCQKILFGAFCKVYPYYELDLSLAIDGNLFLEMWPIMSIQLWNGQFVCNSTKEDRGSQDISSYFL